MNVQPPTSIGDLIEPKQADKVEATLRADEERVAVPRDPIALRILIGIASWFSSLFVLGFLVAGFQPDEGGAIALGTIIMGMMLLFHHKVESKPIFVEQGILACTTAGHLLLLFGLSEFMDGRSEPINYAIAQTLLCTVGVFAYRQSLYRISSLLLAVVLWIHTALDMQAPMLYHLLLSLQVVLFGSLALWRAQSSSYITALAISLLGSIFYLDWMQSSLWQEPLKTPLWPANLAMICLLAATVWRVLPFARTHAAAYLLGIATLALLAIGSTPGILLAVALILYGRGSQDRMVEVLGTGGLFASVAFYYYSLQISLLLKSGTMVISGLACLAIAGYGYRWLRHQESEVPS